MIYHFDFSKKLDPGIFWDLKKNPDKSILAIIDLLEPPNLT